MKRVYTIQTIGFSMTVFGIVIGGGCLSLTTTDQGSSGNGGTEKVPCMSVTDCPSITTCTTMKCTEGFCVAGFVSTGLQCNNDKVCDGAGSCVECVKENDCDGWDDYCYNNECFSCDDNIQNGGETGVDCGGPNCNPCLGTPCNSENDCQPNACIDGVCCDSNCDGVCRSCTVAGSIGKCSVLAAGDEDPGVCDGTKACSGDTKKCSFKNGQPCTDNNQCLSANCSPENICEP
jgi:hypothetical protein